MTSGDKTLWSWTGNTEALPFKFFPAESGWYPA